MSDADLIKLYSGRILELAAEIPATDRLTDPHGSARARSPLCGSSVTVDLYVKEGRIAGYGQDVKACALGQAAASILGAVALGLSRDQICRGRAQLCAMLKDGAAAPDAPFEEMEVLRPAAAFKNRHPSILLAFDATLEALDQAGKADCA